MAKAVYQRGTSVRADDESTVMLRALPPCIKERLKAQVVVDTAVVQMEPPESGLNGLGCLRRVIP